MWVVKERKKERIIHGMHVIHTYIGLPRNDRTRRVRRNKICQLLCDINPTHCSINIVFNRQNWSIPPVSEKHSREMSPLSWNHILDP